MVWGEGNKGRDGKEEEKQLGSESLQGCGQSRDKHKGKEQNEAGQ